LDKTLTEDVRQVRDEVARLRERALAEKQASKAIAPAPEPVASPAPLPVEKAEAAPSPRANPAAPQDRPRLELSDDVERAPSIGPKTAERLQTCGVRTIGDLLSREAVALSKQLGGGWNSPSVILDWQDQARLVLEMPNLRAEQARILTGSGYRTAAAVAEAQPEDLLQDIASFLKGPDGKRAVRGEYTPTMRDMTAWIGWAKQASAVDVRRQSGEKLELPA
jgi:predicted flap endonuclease-1-like 5' DNA nuclease